MIVSLTSKLKEEKRYECFRKEHKRYLTYLCDYESTYLLDETFLTSDTVNNTLLPAEPLHLSLKIKSSQDESITESQYTTYM